MVDETTDVSNTEQFVFFFLFGTLMTNSRAMRNLLEEIYWKIQYSASIVPQLSSISFRRLGLVINLLEEIYWKIQYSASILPQLSSISFRRLGLVIRLVLITGKRPIINCLDPTTV